MSRLETAAFSLSARSTSYIGHNNSTETRSNMQRCGTFPLNMSQSHDGKETDSLTANQRDNRHSIDPVSTNQIRTATKFRDNSPSNVDGFGCAPELHTYTLASNQTANRRRSMNLLPADQMMPTKILENSSLSDRNLPDDMEDDYFPTDQSCSRSQTISANQLGRRGSMGSMIPDQTRTATRFRSGSVMNVTSPSVSRDRNLKGDAFESTNVPPSLESNRFIRSRSTMSMPSNKTETGFRRKSAFNAMEPNRTNLSPTRPKSLESKQMQRRYSMLPLPSNQMGATERFRRKSTFHMAKEANKKQFPGNSLSPNDGLKKASIKGGRRPSISSSSFAHTKPPNTVRKKSISVPTSNSRKTSGFQASTIMSQNRSRAGSTTSTTTERQRKSISINFSRPKQSTTNAESHIQPDNDNNANMNADNLVRDGVHEKTKERSPQKVVLASEISLDANPKSIILVQDNMWIALRNGTVEIRNARSGTLLKTLKPTSNARNFYVTSMYHHHKCVWMGGTDGTLQAWKLNGSKMIGKVVAHTGGVRCITGREETLWSSGEDWSLVQRNMRGSAIMSTTGHHSWIKCMCVAQTGDLWAGTEEGIRVWSNSGKPLSFLNGGHNEAVLSMCIVGSSIWSSSVDGSICVWRISDRRLLRKHNVHKNWVYCVRRVGQDVWSTDVSGEFCVWDAQTGNLRKRLRPKQRKLVDIISSTKKNIERVWLVYRDPGHIKLLTIHIAKKIALAHLQKPLTYVPGNTPGISKGSAPTSSMWTLHKPRRKYDIKQGDDAEHNNVIEAAQRQIRKSRDIDSRLKKSKPPTLFIDPNHESDDTESDKESSSDNDAPVSGRSGSIILSVAKEDYLDNGHGKFQRKNLNKFFEDDDNNEGSDGGWSYLSHTTFNEDSEQERFRLEIEQMKQELLAKEKSIDASLKNAKERLKNSEIENKCSQLQLRASMMFSNEIMEKLRASNQTIATLNEQLQEKQNKFVDDAVKKLHKIIERGQASIQDAESQQISRMDSNTTAHDTGPAIAFLVEEVEQWKIRYMKLKEDSEKARLHWEAKVQNSNLPLEQSDPAQQQHPDESIRIEILKSQLRQQSLRRKEMQDSHSEVIQMLKENLQKMRESRADTEKWHEKMADFVNLSQKYFATLEHGAISSKNSDEINHSLNDEDVKDQEHFIQAVLVDVQKDMKERGLSLLSVASAEDTDSRKIERFEREFRRLSILPEENSLLKVNRISLGNV